MEHKDDILIDRFLRGELTEEEKKNFDERLLDDAGFSERLEEMKALQAGVRESVLEEKRDLLKQLEAEVGSVGQPLETRAEATKGAKQSEGGMKLGQLWLLALAALMIIGAMMLWPKEEVRGPSAEYAQLFSDENFIEIIKHETFRSIDQKQQYTVEQIAAYKLYEAQMFEDAIPLLKDLWVNKQDSIALFYLKYSYLGVGENVMGEQIDIE